ncbi:hypothetical protein JCM11491_006019 [Sporobolomyces phaffii]
MASTPSRHRGSRPQVQNQIGTFGRTTGIRPPDPKRVHRDSNGLENVDDFFNKALDASDSDSQRGLDDSDGDDDDFDRAPSSSKVRSGAKRSTAPKRRQPRPDVGHPSEGQGRKTGIVVPEAPRGSDGFEDVDAFFALADQAVASSPGGYSIAQSSFSRHLHSSARSRRTMADDDDDEEDDSFAEGNTTVLSPSTNHRQTPSGSSHGARSRPSSVRKVTASAAQSSSRTSISARTKPRASSPDRRRDVQEAEDEEEYDDYEVSERQIAPNSRQPKSTPRRFTSLDRDEDRDNSPTYDRGEDEADPAHEEFDLGSDDGAADTTMGDRTLQGVDQSQDEAEETDDGRATARVAKASARKSVARRDRVDPLDKGKQRAPPSDDDVGDEEVADVSVDMEVDDAGDSVEERGPSNRKTKHSRKSEGVASGKQTVRSPERAAVADRKGKGKEVVRSPSPVYNNDYDPAFNQGDSDSEAGNFEYAPFDVNDDPQAQIDDDDQAGAASDGERGQTGDEDQEEEEEEVQPRASTSKAKLPPKSKASAKEKAKPKSKSRVAKAAPSSKSKSKKRLSDASDASHETVRVKRVRKGSVDQEIVIEQIPRDRDVGTHDMDGVRRSTRQRIQPLDHWRNERVVYRKQDAAAGMTAIIRIPKVDPEPLSHAGRRKRGKSSAPPSRGKRARTVKSEVESEDENEDDRIDSMTDPDGLVWSWEGNAETTRRIAFTESMMNPKPSFNNMYGFQKIYQELDYLAGGILDIPVGGKKDTKPAKDNSYLFFCMRGSVSVLCHRTRIAIGKGGTFFIPRGNSYSIESTSNRPVRLFFAQGRRVIELEDGTTRADTQADSQQVRDAQEQAALEAEQEEQSQEGSGQEEEEEQGEEDEEEEEE